MKCAHCNREIPDIEFHSGHVLLNSDGDFACSSRCASDYRANLNWIGGVVAQSEANTLAYLRGDLRSPYDP